MYVPRPIDTSKTELPEELIPLVEQLAENNHEIWAAQRIKEGWTYGPKRDDLKKEHPDLVPFAELTESEKEYDRNSAIENIKAIILMGFKVMKDEGSA